MDAQTIIEIQGWGNLLTFEKPPHKFTFSATNPGAGCGGGRLRKITQMFSFPTTSSTPFQAILTVFPSQMGTLQEVQF